MEGDMCAPEINLVGFNVDNPKNGEMLQYDEAKVAFINTNKIEV